VTPFQLLEADPETTVGKKTLLNPQSEGPGLAYPSTKMHISPFLPLSRPRRQVWPTTAHVLQGYPLPFCCATTTRLALPKARARARLPVFWGFVIFGRLFRQEAVCPDPAGPGPRNFAGWWGSARGTFFPPRPPEDRTLGSKVIQGKRLFLVGLCHFQGRVWTLSFSGCLFVSSACLACC